MIHSTIVTSPCLQGSIIGDIERIAQDGIAGVGWAIHPRPAHRRERGNVPPRALFPFQVHGTLYCRPNPESFLVLETTVCPKQPTS